MKTRKRKDVGKILLEGTSVDQAIGRAVLEAIRRHKKAGNPIAVARNGRTVLINPEEITLEDDGLATEALP